MAALSIEAVAKFYGATTALAEVSFTVESGEFVTLLGPSGSGKTTLLMIVAGSRRPIAGGSGGRR
jgi:ABC-type Fe3+/spermidine/putrescine transport system ATPase subunit